MEPAVMVSILSLLVALASFFFSMISHSKSNALSQENTRLANGMLELEVRSSISNVSLQVNEIALKLRPVQKRRKAKDFSPEEEEEYQSLLLHWKAANQNMLTAYDEACAKYLDNKIDKVRFKRNFHHEIRNLLESDGLKQFFDPHTSRFKAIIKVYTEWENLEK